LFFSPTPLIRSLFLIVRQEDGDLYQAQQLADGLRTDLEAGVGGLDKDVPLYLSVLSVVGNAFVSGGRLEDAIAMHQRALTGAKAVRNAAYHVMCNK
jgi:hypothetical protein